MKRFLIENAGILHISLAILWFIGMMLMFIAGELLVQKAIFIPIVSLTALVLQIAFSVVESEWTEQVLGESGYNE